MTSYMNPVYGIIVPFLFIVTIPMAIVAGITTTLAFFILMFRVLLVYINIAMSFIPQYIMGSGDRVAYRYPRGYEDSGHLRPSDVPNLPLGRPNTLQHRGRSLPVYSLSGASRVAPGRRSGPPSRGSPSPAGTIAPITEFHGGGKGMTSPASGNLRLGKSSSTGGGDFEGLDDWPLEDKDDDGWLKINSRQALPARHHYRSSSGDVSYLSEGSWLTMKGANSGRRTPEGPPRDRSGHLKKASISPNSSRFRSNPSLVVTPTSRDPEEGYFSPLPRI